VCSDDRTRVATRPALLSHSGSTSNYGEAVNDETWSSGSWSEAATGDVGPWARWLPKAWAMAADPNGTQEPPPDPHRLGVHDELIAWWAPITQLATSGLGWAYPIRGLARWDQTGRPASEPILSAVQRWWGDKLDALLAAGADWQPAEVGGPDLTWLRPMPVARGTLFQQYWHLPSDQNWIETWGNNGNAFHLWPHVGTALGDELPPTMATPANSGVLKRLYRQSGSTPPRDVLLLDEYRGWYGQLLNTGPGQRDGRNRRVDVVVRPLGWLGQYRRSTDTGLWFRGPHHIHELGNN
jgi:hypothetical protein